MSEYLLPISVICATLGYGLGVGPVLFALLGEILPLKIKSMATAIIVSLREVSIYLPITRVRHNTFFRDPRSLTIILPNHDLQSLTIIF